MVRLARSNGETLYSPNANGNPVDWERKAIRTWDLAPSDLGRFTDDAIARGVTFVASEWGVPSVEYLAGRADVQVITVIRHPITRLLSNYRFDRLRGYTSAESLRTYVNHPKKQHTHFNYYTELLNANIEKLLDPAHQETRIAHAIDRLSLLHHVAVLEAPNPLLGLAKSVGWEHQATKSNASDSPDSDQFMPSAEETAWLEAGNALDLEFYRRIAQSEPGVERVSARFKLPVPDGLAH